MPTYEVTGPDGHTYEVTAPDGASQQDVMIYVQAHHQATAPITGTTGGEQPSLVDRAIASPIGRAVQENIVKPVLNLGSMLGDAPGMGMARMGMAGLTGAVSPLLGLNGNQSIKAMGSMLQNPGSQVAAQEGNAYGSAIQRNQNTPGYAEQRAIADKAVPLDSGSFTGSLFPGINPSLAGTVGLASSYPLDSSNAMADAAKAAQDKYGQDHPIGSFAGGLLGGLMAAPEGAMQKGLATPMLLKPSVPSVADLKSAAGQAYDRVDQAGHIISAPSYDAMVGDLQQKLADEGIDQTLHPNALAAYKRLDGATGQPVTFKGLDTLRKVAGDAISGSTLNKADQRMGYMIQNHIDDFVNGLKPTDLIGGTDATGTINDLNQARDLWSRASQADLIQKQIDKAGIKASANYSQSGAENALRQQFKSLALNDKAMARLSPDVRQAVKDVATGSPVANVLRAIGKYAPHGPVATAAGMGLGAMAGGLTGAAEGGMASIAIPMAGEAARAGATSMTKAAAQRAMDIAASGGAANIPKAAPMLQLPQITAQSQIPYGMLPLLMKKKEQSYAGH